MTAVWFPNVNGLKPETKNRASQSWLASASLRLCIVQEFLASFSCQAVAVRRLVLLLSLILPFVAVAATNAPIQERADRFLALANSGYQALFRVNSEAQWLAVTDVTPDHDAAAEATAKAYAAFNGNPALIGEARELLTH
jgi:hypothetical protein